MTDYLPCHPSSYRHPELDSGSKRDKFTHFSIPGKVEFEKCNQMEK